MTFQVSKERGMALRQELLAKAKRVVVKVGSAVLTKADGLNLEVMASLAHDLCDLMREGREVVLVSSGAVAAGRKSLGLGTRALVMREKQAAAALGQGCLMRQYEDIFGRQEQLVGQLLLTHDDLANRDRYLNIRNTLFTMFDWQILPIINENDTVSVKELRFGDNDTLGAMTTNMIEADLFVCLTDVDGLYSGNPASDPSARLLNTVAQVNDEVLAMAGHVAGALGTGGMRSKIMAARMVSARGGSSCICHGRQPGTLKRLFAGEPVGTFFLPQEEKMQSRKHWIAYTLRPKGFLVLDDGAARAVVGGGKSLLPSGILETRGTFRIGDPVHCLDRNEEALAAGLVNYSSDDIKKIQGLRSALIKETLGFMDSEEIIHRDNLVVL
ncbi:MAG: glutamate 5-kinase [Desulfobulbaceae bacterium]|nr:glutamate 5-kinase [Desulfobulbaceae bacterium]